MATPESKPQDSHQHSASTEAEMIQNKTGPKDKMKSKWWIWRWFGKKVKKKCVSRSNSEQTDRSLIIRSPEDGEHDEKHEILPCEEDIRPTNIIEEYPMVPVFCVKHTTQMIEYYCKSCKSAMCSMCKSQEHTGRKCKTTTIKHEIDKLCLQTPIANQLYDTIQTKLKELTRDALKFSQETTDAGLTLSKSHDDKDEWKSQKDNKTSKWISDQTKAKNLLSTFLNKITNISNKRKKFEVKEAAFKKYLVTLQRPSNCLPYNKDNPETYTLAIGDSTFTKGNETGTKQKVVYNEYTASQKVTCSQQETNHKIIIPSDAEESKMDISRLVAPMITTGDLGTKVVTRGEPMCGMMPFSEEKNHTEMDSKETLRKNKTWDDSHHPCEESEQNIGNEARSIEKPETKEPNFEIACSKKYSLTEEETIDLRNTINDYADVLFNEHSNLSVISGSPVKTKGDTVTRNPCIVLYSKNKDQIPPGEKSFPSKIGKFDVDVKNGHFITSADPDFSEYLRKTYNEILTVGCSMGPTEFPIGATVGLFVCDQLDPNNIGFLTCCHPFYAAQLNQNGRQADLHVTPGQVVTQPASSNGDNVIGQVKRTMFGRYFFNNIKKVTSFGLDAAFVRTTERHPLQLGSSANLACLTESERKVQFRIQLQL